MQPLLRSACALALFGLMIGSPVHAQSAGGGAAAAPQFDPNEPPKKRLDRLEREVNEVRSIVLQARATGKPVEIKDAGPDPEVAALQTKLDDLETTLRGLTGQVEELGHRADQARQDAATAQAAAGALSDRMDKLEKTVALLTAPPPPPAPPANAAAVPPAATGPAAAVDAKSAYDQARQLMLSGDYPGAAAALQAYLDRYGDQPSAPTARYWLGKVKYAEGDYAGAAEASIASIRGWPKTAWAPDAVIDMSQALIKLNKPDDACAALHELERKYPKAPPATKSRAAAVRQQAQCGR
ncbi:tol-pal system protein YbgF [Phenylobacterium montanum]|uniref:Cell division coordinator CpoB n=1 Tax=Phenylobacterium montanum TaxID=2823693 RepID=A0A975IU42_9CAUL|nr:tol-pal system protein YbgF [Caulobacter sp. S6]QUD87134.1 tol-pal system protein YbgF [Caulobacter sp. S6]